MPITVDQAEEDADIDRILGDRLLFDLSEPQRYGGPSVPTIYRLKNAGLLQFVKSGNRSKLNRLTMKRLLGKGIALTNT
jgi:hypothetical protein